MSLIDVQQWTAPGSSLPQQRRVVDTQDRTLRRARLETAAGAALLLSLTIGLLLQRYLGLF
jgi:hypothetical protein